MFKRDAERAEENLEKIGQWVGSSTQPAREGVFIHVLIGGQSPATGLGQKGLHLCAEHSMREWALDNSHIREHQAYLTTILASKAFLAQLTSPFLTQFCSLKNQN